MKKLLLCAALLAPMISCSPVSHAAKLEADYVKETCKGVQEYRLKDDTRVDCLTAEYAIEYDFAKKWAEGIGQAQYYSVMTGKKPKLVLIGDKQKDKRFITRAKVSGKDAGVIVELIKK